MWWQQPGLQIASNHTRIADLFRAIIRQFQFSTYFPLSCSIIWIHVCRTHKYTCGDVANIVQNYDLYYVPVLIYEVSENCICCSKFELSFDESDDVWKRWRTFKVHAWRLYNSLWIQREYRIAIESFSAFDFLLGIFELFHSYPSNNLQVA